MQPSTFSTRLAACGGGEGGASPVSWPQPSASGRGGSSSSRAVSRALQARGGVASQGGGRPKQTSTHDAAAHLLQRVALHTDGIIQVAGGGEVLASVSAAGRRAAPGWRPGQHQQPG